MAILWQVLDDLDLGQTNGIQQFTFKLSLTRNQCRIGPVISGIGICLSLFYLERNTKFEIITFESNFWDKFLSDKVRTYFLTYFKVTRFELLLFIKLFVKRSGGQNVWICLVILKKKIILQSVGLEGNKALGWDTQG